VSRTLTIETTIHGRVLVEDAVVAVPGRGTLVGFHGYGQSAEDMLAELAAVPGASEWTLVSVQALHRFYARDQRRVIASWMTRQDREQAIADNVEYVSRVLDGLTTPVIVVGFSQGVAMAYRAALLGGGPVAGIVAVAGDIPPELKVEGVPRREWPPTLLATGSADPWYAPARLADDATFLSRESVPHETLTFAGAHEWTDELRSAIAAWLRGGGWALRR
jgi:predicted esterase